MKLVMSWLVDVANAESWKEHKICFMRKFHQLWDIEWDLSDRRYVGVQLYNKLQYFRNEKNAWETN